MVIEIGCTKVLDTPIGRLAISGSDKAVVELAFLMGDTKRVDFSTSIEAEAQVDEAIKWITNYFAGERSDYSGELDLAGTDFQRAVWAERCLSSPLALHADNGSPMKGATMKVTMERLGVTASFSHSG